jgi:hypothetical protein
MFFSLRRLPCLTSRSYKKYYFMHSLHNSYLHCKCGRLYFTGRDFYFEARLRRGSGLTKTEPSKMLTALVM